jgi:hypothetical protein
MKTKLGRPSKGVLARRSTLGLPVSAYEKEVLKLIAADRNVCMSDLLRPCIEQLIRQYTAKEAVTHD